MRLYKTTLTPLSNFATTLRGDTLFGQLCWAIRYSFGEDRLIELLSSYKDKPFLIVSDGFASGYLPKPTAPMEFLREDITKKKENRKQKWLTLKELQNADFSQAKTDEEVKSHSVGSVTIKNSLNYKTFHTDDSGIFSPYGIYEFPLNTQDLYFLIDESKYKLIELHKALEMVASMNYGKKASIGKGSFLFGDFESVELGRGSDTFMALSPFVLEGDKSIKECYYEPFTRFGKHGAGLANKNPFKSPLLLADSKAVIVCQERQNDLQYIGKAIKGHSSNPHTVHQGYSIVIPIQGAKS